MSEYTSEYWQEMIDDIMDNFDFDKVHRCMTALEWHWSGCDGVPEKSELRKCARKILKGCVERGHGGTGGFQVTIDREEGCLSLSFVVEDWGAYKE